MKIGQGSATFTLFGKKISYDANRVEYNRIRYIFESYASECADKLDEEYSAFGGLDEFYARYENWIMSYFYECCDIAVSELVKLKHRGLDRDSYFEEVFDCKCIGDVIQPIEKFYDELAEKNEERREAHSKRFHKGTHLRGNYYDGSETMLTAMTNIGGGAAALGVNALASGINFLVDSGNKSELYEKSREPMINAVLYCLRTAYWDLIEYARENCSGFEVSNISNADQKQSLGIYKNLCEGKIPQKEQKECIIEIMQLNPYIDGVYYYAFENYGDPDLDLQKLAEFFHINGLELLQVKMLHKYYKTLDVSSEGNAIEARKTMSARASYLGISDYTEFIPLEQKIADYDLHYRTVGGIIRASREEADAQKALQEYFNSLDFETSKSAALASHKKLSEKAKSLKISADWLEPYVEYAFKKIRRRAEESLEEFYKSLEITSEEQAWQTREIIARKAAELEIDDFENYHPLEQLIGRYDRAFRTVGDTTFDTRDEAVKQKKLWAVYTSDDYRKSEAAAIEMKSKLESIVNDEGIDGSWLIKRIETALVHYDESARTKFDYRFATREEAERAATDESVFCKAVWTYISEYAKTNSFLLRWNVIPADKRAAITESLQAGDEPFVYLHTTLLNTGKSGFAFTPSGLIWNNGSEFMLGIANNVVFKTLFKQKSEDMQQKNQIQKLSITWKEFFESDGAFSMDEKKNITIVPGKLLEASHTKVAPFLELLQKLHSLKNEIQINFSGNPLPVPPDDALCKAPEITPLPEVETIADKKIKPESKDFTRDKSSIPAPEEPFPDNFVLLQLIAKYRDQTKDLMIAPNIPEEQYNNFLGELDDEDIQKSAQEESPICQADHTLMFRNGKKGFLLTAEALYYQDGGSEWKVYLSDIVDVCCEGNSLEITCSDFDETYDMKGEGVPILAEILEAFINGKVAL